MGRRAKSPKGKARTKKPRARRGRDLEKRLAEAQEQQAATSEILRVISGSPTDVQPVFDTIVRTGAGLCEADYGFLARYDGTSMSIVAHSGATNAEIEAVLRVYPTAPAPDSLGGRTILERAVNAARPPRRVARGRCG